MILNEKQIAAFWAKVDKSGECWMWTASKRDGYGLFRATHGAPMTSAHRWSWTFAHGAIPDGIQVLHRCDVRACVNPAHLFLGTLQDNMRDRNQKQRQARGARAGRATIDEATVMAIKALNPDGRKARWGEARAVAERFGIADRQIITHIWHGRTWRHI